MRCIRKTSMVNRALGILNNNEGASIVLVTIISIIVVTSVIILAISVNPLMTSADKQYHQDQAYVAAKSMGAAIDKQITASGNSVKLEDYDGVVLISDNDLTNNIAVTAKVEKLSADMTYNIIVTANSSGEEYACTLTFYGSNGSYMRLS